MARLPKNANEAVELLGIASESTVMALGPAQGYVEALADAVGTQGKVYVVDPPPDLKTRKKAVEVVSSPPEEGEADAILVWVGIFPLREVREPAQRVRQGGVLWLMLPRAERDRRAGVTEGEAKRLLLPLGWKDTKVVPLSTESLAVRFTRRR